MVVGKKGAVLMLLVVALWAATPGLACLAPSPSHICCRGLMMGCDAAAMSTGHSCCELQSNESNTTPGRAAVSEPLPNAAQMLTAVHLPALDGIAGLSPNPANAPPPRSSWGARTILRI